MDQTVIADYAIGYQCLIGRSRDSLPCHNVPSWYGTHPTSTPRGTAGDFLGDKATEV